MRSSLGARADCDDLDPAVVSCLPFSRDTFKALIESFQIHGTIARTINRNTSYAFIRKFCSWDSLSQRAIVYNCRSNASWKGDLALSVTFRPSDMTTHAVMYGCDKETTEEITQRLTNTDIEVFHPMVLPALFAELERNRLDRLARRKISQLLQRIISISENVNLEQYGSAPASITEWLEMGEIRNGLLTFKRKMQDMIEHVEELQNTIFSVPDIKGPSQQGPDLERVTAFRVAGTKIEERLKHLVDEFDELIRKCATMIDGVTLASQLEWNQIGRKDTVTNLEIAHNGLEVAQHTRRDSELMKSIALLTMIFLPATFVATLFSMGFFNYQGPNGDILRVSPYIWLYFVVTILVTSVAFGIWYLLIKRRRQARGDVEKQAGSFTEKKGKKLFSLNSGSLATSNTS
ncbi:hypothetical protein F5Y18DRAFT_71372 [Xylariaceae sp. FL1019]|nr:hypothetical protein F5Y18DRAFT_71372 [Xylariaceae sp. FL1019]